jgi:hypothetical protein
MPPLERFTQARVCVDSRLLGANTPIGFDPRNAAMRQRASEPVQRREWLSRVE